MAKLISAGMTDVVSDGNFFSAFLKAYDNGNIYVGEKNYETGKFVRWEKLPPTPDDEEGYTEESTK